ncbi:MAG: hypothetical protein WC675_00035 [Patescibacteria group bacterium]|jgi:hypothetical protein
MTSQEGNSGSGGRIAKIAVMGTQEEQQHILEVLQLGRQVWNEAHANRAELLLGQPGLSRVQIIPVGTPDEAVRTIESLEPITADQVDADVQGLLEDVLTYEKRRDRDQGALDSLEEEVPGLKTELARKRTELAFDLSQLEGGQLATAVKDGVRVIFSSGETEGSKGQYYLQTAKGTRVALHDQGQGKLLADRQQAIDSLAKEVDGKSNALDRLKAQAPLLVDMIEAARGRAVDAVDDMLLGAVKNGQAIVLFLHNQWQILRVKRTEDCVFCTALANKSFVEKALAQREFVEAALAQREFVADALKLQGFVTAALAKPEFVTAALGSQTLVEKVLANPSVVNAALEEGALILSPELAAVLRRYLDEYRAPQISGMRDLLEAVLGDAESADTE